MKYRFRSKAEVYHALHNLSAGGEAPNFRKSLRRLQIEKFISVLPVPFY